MFCVSSSHIILFDFIFTGHSENDLTIDISFDVPSSTCITLPCKRFHVILSFDLDNHIILFFLSVACCPWTSRPSDRLLASLQISPCSASSLSMSPLGINFQWFRNWDPAVPSCRIRDFCLLSWNILHQVVQPQEFRSQLIFPIWSHTKLRSAWGHSLSYFRYVCVLRWERKSQALHATSWPKPC